MVSGAREHSRLRGDQHGEKDWQDLGSLEALRAVALREIQVGKRSVALSYADGRFGAISSACNHVGGLRAGAGSMETTRCVRGTTGSSIAARVRASLDSSDRVPRYGLREDAGHLWIRVEPATHRHKTPHPPHKLTLPSDRGDGPIRVLGISTTTMTEAHPRYPTSEALLEIALAQASNTRAAETRT